MLKSIEGLERAAVDGWEQYEPYRKQTIFNLSKRISQKFLTPYFMIINSLPSIWFLEAPTFVRNTIIVKDNTRSL